VKDTLEMMAKVVILVQHSTKRWLVSVHDSNATKMLHVNHEPCEEKNC